MSRFKNEIAHLQAHVKTLRIGLGALFLMALVLGFGCAREMEFLGYGDEES